MKEHFEEYTEIDNMLRELYLDLEVVNAKLYGVSAQNFENKVPTTNPKDNTLYYIAKRDGIKERIDDLEQKKKALFDKHIEEINKVENESGRSILRCWYLYRQSSFEIAKLLNISVPHLFKLKRKAIDEFKLKNDIN